MKKQIVILGLLLLLSGIARSTVYIRYYNADSKTYKFEVKIAGTMTTVEFGGSRTSTVTIQGGSSECIVYTPCGEVKLTNDVKISIKNGCISIG
jgi:hypothetical protein